MRTTNDLRLGLLRQPGHVAFGPGQRAQLPSLVRRLGTSVLICTDERMAGSEVFADIVKALRGNGLTVSVFSAVEPELPRDNLLGLIEEFGGTDLDVVIGIGGGSCLDFAKIGAILLTRGGDVRDLYGEFQVPGPGLPVITVPTTGGTGAEVTCISVIHDPDLGMKVGVASPYLEAHAAVVDPELTLTCPRGLTAATGADALSHLIESFTARAKNPGTDDIEQHLYVGKNVLTDVYARHGLALLNTSLERLAEDLSDLGARSDTMLGALSAGMAINTTGTAGAHAIQSPIGALTHTAHGFGVGALLPYVMRYNLPAREPEFAEVADVLGVADPGQSRASRARAGIERVDAILAALDVPPDLRELGLKPEQFDTVAEQALRARRLTANNPRELTKGSVLEILERGYHGDRGWWGE
ncbi:iron-containing alcohol dehydrogenase [Prauserella flavalba]|uniref:Alcohol dehydrogenase n=1 Tax=Prauserella flavalba TaxID=1477506 RepID=A0A318LBX0_9PSEU|nr:iron-containing alcohol dehydrogenase [Prauserella flavalba]PXY21545.1 alcohol dehydrogenase [Prauserella flavalba]